MDRVTVRMILSKFFFFLLSFSVRNRSNSLSRFTIGFKREELVRFGIIYGILGKFGEFGGK